MKFIHQSVPDVTVVTEEKGFEIDIKSMQYLDEQDDRVYLKCAEFVPAFKRGFVCDLVTHYETVNQVEEEKEQHSDVIRDLVLVYINKEWDVLGRPVFEYVFYK